MEINDIARMRSATGTRLLHLHRRDIDGTQHLIFFGAEPASRVAGAAPGENANVFFSIKGFDKTGPDWSISTGNEDS